MNKTVPVIGFLILAIMAISVFGFATYKALTTQILFGAILAVLLAGFLFTLWNESKALSSAKAENLFGQKNLINVACVLVAALVAYALNFNLKLGAVVAVGAVGVVAGLLVKDYAAALYTGALIGMASKTVLPGFTHVIVAGIVAGIVYVLALAVFGGFGGKLGTMAVSGVTATALALGTGFNKPAAVPAWSVGWQLLVAAVVGALASYYINNNLKQGPVTGSAVVGLVAGLIALAFPKAIPNIGAMATVIICGSFAGMSNTKRVPSFVRMAIVGAVLGVVYMFAAPFLGGAGGKLGCMAFGSNMAVRGVFDAFDKFGKGK
jgi:hypothetical protein